MNPTRSENKMKVEISPTRKVVVLGVDKRRLESLAWCASTYGANRLYWVNGYLLCLEVYEKSFEHEIKTKEFPISQVCYTRFPEYSKTFEVERGVKIPIVDVSEMRIFKNLLRTVLNKEKEKTAPSSPGT
jgi:hypothetical protein